MGTGDTGITDLSALPRLKVRHVPDSHFVLISAGIFISASSWTDRVERCKLFIFWS
jgi:hypothetical protein